MAWFEDDPERLQRELIALEAAGLPFKVNDDARHRRGVIEIAVTVPLEGEARTMVATYPDEFPYFKPQVHGPNVGYAHHFNPTTSEYCLLETGRGSWLPSDTLAWLLTDQIALVAAANAPEMSTGEATHFEVAQAEPFSCYVIPKNPAEYIVVDSALDRNGQTSGWARLVYTDDDPLRGHVVELSDADGRSISGPVRLPRTKGLKNGSNPGSVRVPWVQLAEAPGATDVDAWWAAVSSVNPSFDQHVQGVPGRTATTVARAHQFVLVGFPEETSHRELGQGWVVLIRTRERRNKPWRHSRVVRVERAGHLDLFQREPRLVKMADASIVLVGLGGLGGELARLLACMAPDRLALIDGDVASSATAVRNVGAFRASGFSKAQVTLDGAHETQPYTDLSGYCYTLGQPRRSSKASGQAADEEPVDIAGIVRKSHLVIDATADLSAQHYLSDIARHHGVAYLRSEALPGVWSGFIGLQRPDATVCWMCWQHHLSTTIPRLPEEPGGTVQPPGCGDPTYTGAGFDLAAIAAQTARVAASYLTGTDGYGAIRTDVMTVRFRDTSGAPTPPAWDAWDLDRHPQCPNHD